MTLCTFVLRPSVAYLPCGCMKQELLHFEQIIFCNYCVLTSDPTNWTNSTCLTINFYEEDNTKIN